MYRLKALRLNVKGKLFHKAIYIYPLVLNFKNGNWVKRFSDSIILASFKVLLVNSSFEVIRQIKHKTNINTSMNSNKWVRQCRAI